MKKALSIAVVGALVVLSGCATKVETRYQVDPTTGEEVKVVSENRSFWASENLETHYRFEMERSRHAAESAAQKISAIQTEAIRTAPMIEDPVARALHGILTQMQVALVQTTPGPSGVAAPKTAADFWSPNLVPMLGLGLQAYQVFGGSWGDSWSQQNSTSTDSPSVSMTGSGNVMLFKSDGSMNPSYQMSVGEGANTLTLPGIGGYTMEENHTTNETRGDSSNGLSLF